MCRIVGFASQTELPNREGRLTAMLRSVAHGGPDDEGTFYDHHLALGHRRLSIIDLTSAGHQPMRLGEELVITFNGEIYNYQSLRSELQDLGNTFITHTDTEVILHAYRQWGPAAFDRLEGIFAFALYDRTQNVLLLVRDHVGVKPLYYSLDRGQLVFGSEVRVFRQFDPHWREDENWKIHFLAFGSIPHPFTTLHNVFQVKPGSFLTIRLSDISMTATDYRQPAASVKIADSSALPAMASALQAAVAKNLIADAPIGVFLSGGIDSTLLTLLADRIHNGVKTVSVNFEEASFDERPFQHQVLERLKVPDHRSSLINEELFWQSLPEIWEAMDQPTIDGVNSFFVSKSARDSGLKAVLSGLGADETFGGYASFDRVKWLRRLRALLPFKYHFAILLGHIRPEYRRLMFLDLEGPVSDYLFLRGIHTPDAIARMLQVPEKKVWDILQAVTVDIAPGLDGREYISALESKFYMTNQLLKDVDVMSMWHGLEVRVPFLDVRLLELADTIPSEVRYQDQKPKYLLTESLPGLLPESITQRQKKGFTFPLSEWIKRRGDHVRTLLPAFDDAPRMLRQFESGKKHWSKIWSLVVLQQFTARQHDK